jgi:Zn-finger nucleic acid-binding protein
MTNNAKEESQQQIELLKILAEGCRKHPAYRARRAATERCPECMVVWKARCELNKILATPQ